MINNAGKPPTSGGKSLLDRGNKAKIPKANEPVKLVHNQPTEIPNEENKTEILSEPIIETNKKESSNAIEEEIKTTVVVGQDKKFMKRLQNSVKRFTNTGDTAISDSIQTKDRSSTILPSQGIQKKGMTKVVQSKKILETAKLLENKILNKENDLTENKSQTNTTESNKITEESKCEEIKDVNKENNEYMNELDGMLVNKAMAKSTVRKVAKKAII